MSSIILAFTVAASAFASGRSAAGNESALERIRRVGEVSIGIEGTYPPHTYHNERDELVGYDVEVARRIAENIGVKAKFIESRWDSLIIGVDSGLWDLVINNVAVTDARKEKYDFSIPYAYVRGVLITRSDNREIKSFEDLKGKKSAQTVTSNWAAQVSEYGAEIVGTDGFNQSIDLVVSGRADTTLNDNGSYYDYKKSHSESPVDIVAFAERAVPIGVLLPQGEPDLLAAINKALEELEASGELTAISQKYFGADISKL
jgi:cystine transport system substrate-binding protein